ncbi:MAG: c-type cytochrome domain-containing protein [Candidatus Desulfatibia sp.]|uniref:c-type cytochrome domain-containing protein n=1 Tax=Candidatus Desulfatibia sp. TaxID=3101189 RepID=UPI002F2BE45D
MSSEKFAMDAKIENSTQRTFLTPWVLWVLFLLCIASIQEARSQSEENVTYADLAPIFAKRCIMCHSGVAAPLGLHLDKYDSILKGSERGPVVKAGDPSTSELIRRLKGISQPRMPMTGPPYLPDTQIAMFERWVVSGMPKGDVAQVKLSPESISPLPLPGELVSYRHVAPIFAKRCAKCHTKKGLMGPAPEGYRLTSYKATLSISDRVRVVPGNAGASELVRRIRGQARPRMPFDGPPYLTDSEIRLIEDWVTQGARDFEGNPAAVPVGATVRLHGILGPRWQLDGLDLIISPGTRIDKSPTPGDYVEVRGRLGVGGEVKVERLRRR